MNGMRLCMARSRLILCGFILYNIVAVRKIHHEFLFLYDVLIFLGAVYALRSMYPVHCIFTHTEQTTYSRIT